MAKKCKQKVEIRWFSLHIAYQTFCFHRIKYFKQYWEIISKENSYCKQTADTKCCDLHSKYLNSYVYSFIKAIQVIKNILHICKLAH